LSDVVTLDGNQGAAGIENHLKWFAATVNLTSGRKGITERLGCMWVHLLHRPLVYPATKDLTIQFYDFTGLAAVWAANKVTLWANKVTLWANKVILWHFIKIENVFN
jgi:hypothetical protein